MKKGPFSAYANTGRQLDLLVKHLRDDHDLIADFQADGYTKWGGLQTASFCLMEAIILHNYAHERRHEDGHYTRQPGNSKGV